jgi:hypothetical protein
LPLSPFCRDLFAVLSGRKRWIAEWFGNANLGGRQRGMFGDEAGGYNQASDAEQGETSEYRS